MSRLTVIDNLRIASPCDASWAEMKGDAQRRHCAHCDKNVYNLTELEPDEIVQLIEETEGQFCGRMYQRSDGTVLTEDCPIGLARVLRRAKRRGYQAAAFALTLAASAASLFLYGSPRSDHIFGPDRPVTEWTQALQPEPLIMGKMAPEPTDKPAPPPTPEPERFIMGDVYIPPDK